MPQHTRTRPPLETEEPVLDTAEVVDIPDEEVELFLATMPEEKKKGFWNLPNIAGLSLILVGIAYLLQQLGLWSGIDLSFLVTSLPWVGALLILLIGTGLLSRSSRRPKPGKRPKPRKPSRVRVKKRMSFPSFKVSTHGRLTKSRNKKIAGVCAGLAEYFGLDPTLVRAIFAVGFFISGGQLLLLYLLLAFIMPPPDAHSHAA